jgi:hypothetical protein
VEHAVDHAGSLCRVVRLPAGATPGDEFPVVRLGWRRARPPPALPPEVALLPRRLSPPCIVGIVTFIWHRRAFDLGLFRVDFGVRSNRAIFHPTEDIHGYLAYTLFALVSIHLFAALWHQFV